MDTEQYMNQKNDNKRNDNRTTWNHLQHLEPSPLPDGISHFIMSSFYSEPGTADACMDKLQNEEARVLYRAQLAYYRGHIKEAEQLAEELQEQDIAFESRVECVLLMGICAMYTGNTYKWNRCQMLLTSMEHEKKGHPAVTIVRTAMHVALHVDDVPEWLKKGKFSSFPSPIYPSLMDIYARWLSSNRRYEALLAVIEPLITSAQLGGSLLAQAYLHLTAAIAYYSVGDKEDAIEHIEMALDLTLPDQLYGVLAEHRRQLGRLLGDALKARDTEAFSHMCSAYKQLETGFKELHNALTGKQIAIELTLREYELSDLAARGMRNAEIARRMGITEGSVKTYLSIIYQKLGISNRDDLKKYLL